MEKPTSYVMVNEFLVWCMSTREIEEDEKKHEIIGDTGKAPTVKKGARI